LGAWIEITEDKGDRVRPESRSPLGAWIEIVTIRCMAISSCVAPPWERGLKYGDELTEEKIVKVAPPWERGLKY